MPPVDDAAAAEPVIEGMDMSMLEVPIGIFMMGARAARGQKVCRKLRLRSEDKRIFEQLKNDYHGGF